LIYKGPLKAEGKSGGNTRQKHEIRKEFHRQLVELWKQHPDLVQQSQQRFIRYTTPLNMISDPGPGVPQIARSDAPYAKTWVEHIADDHVKFGYRFVPLISTTGGFTCSLDILFLRRDNPGNLITDGGDIDNRIKTLFDGFKMPKFVRELGGYDVPDPGENPFFCLLEDDSLITKVAITTDRLLIPLDSNAGERLNDVHLVIHVTMSNPSAVFAGNRLV